MAKINIRYIGLDINKHFAYSKVLVAVLKAKEYFMEFLAMIM
ncbi:hypothetical protein [Phascolarctobacterium sp.]